MEYEKPAPAWEDMNKQQRLAAEYAWSTGILDHCVMLHQRVLWAIICHHVGLETKFPLPDEYKSILARTNSKKPLVLEIARRFGKSSLVLLAMIALCIKNKKRTYYFCSPSEGNAENILNDVYPALIDSCPPARRPKRVKLSLEFSNGSRIRIGGLFNGAEGLRGMASSGSAVDEAGAIPCINPTSCLTYVLGSVLRPQLMTTKGWCVLLTTPPANMNHDYYDMVTEAQFDGRFIRMDIYQNTAFTPEEIEEEKKASYSDDPTGGAWSREYLCKAIADAKALIIPEATQELLKPNIRQYPRPPYFEYLYRLTAMDHGTVDLNAILYGYWDFPNAKLIVEKELVIPDSPTTKKIAKEFAAGRKELWGELPIKKAICDSISQQLRIDLNDELKGNPFFLAPMKSVLLDTTGEREGMVNKLLMALSEGQIVIDPVCKLLVETIRTATWKVSLATGRREFGRDKKIGHSDMLAALMYLWISVTPLRNDNPLVGVNAPSYVTHFVNPNQKPPQQRSAAVLERALNKMNPTRSIFDRLKRFG